MSTFCGDAVRPRPQSAVALSIFLSALAACSAPEPAPLTPRELEHSLRERAELPAPSPEEVAAALELSGLDPTAAARPPAAVEAEVDPRAWWRARGETWAPQVRAARRRLEAALARARSAGAPGPLQLSTEIRELDDLSAMTRVMGTVDLVGLLDLEPALAARALADAQSRAALGELDLARWRARFEVDASRARLAAAREALAALNELEREVALDGRRIEVLARHGRLSKGALAASELAAGELHRLHALEITRESAAREALAVASGLPSTAAALDGAPYALHPTSAPEVVAPDAEALFERLPELRLALFDYALAEARLRATAAERWPGLRLGPHLAWQEADLFWGAVAGADIPWPGALDGRIEAAHVEREAARERVEDALLAAMARRAGALEQLANARDHLDGGALPTLAASARRWSAARAALAVDSSTLAEWSDALRMRAMALVALSEARGMHALAELELEQAQGQEPRERDLRLAGEVLP